MPDGRTSLAEALRGGGAVALSLFGRVHVRQKADGTEVTDADEAAEAALVSSLAASFPGDSVISEEGGRVVGGEATWWVDPIDGTSAFIDRLAHWGPTAVRIRGRRCEIGGFYMPRLDELWLGVRGGGAFRDDERLGREPAYRRGSDAVVLVPSRFHRAGPLDWRGKVRALGSTAAHLALVAGGHAAAAIVPNWQPWDVGCGLLMIGEVGLQVRTLDGALVAAGDLPTTDGQPFVAGDPATVDALVTSIQSALRRSPGAFMPSRSTHS